MMRSAESNMRKPCTILLIAASVSAFCVDSCLLERPVPQIYAANAVLSRRPQSSTTQPAVWLAVAGPPGVGTAIVVQLVSPTLSSPDQCGPAMSAARGCGPLA